MHRFFERFEGKEFIFLDGAMGTQLQKNGLQPGDIPEVFGMRHPEVTERIHGAYIDSGSDVIYTNTFGVNRKKLRGTGLSVEAVVSANVAAAKRAAAGRTSVALDIGPLGELMEPLGSLSFDEAYDMFREILTAGEAAGADLVILETFADLAEIRTAILAAKENTSLPVFATMTFEEGGRTFTGCLAESFAETADGLGVDAVGVNCSLGPDSLMPIIERIGRVTDLPLIVKANAGLPDTRDGHYDIGPEDFARSMTRLAELGVRIAGGCCGTDPEYIRALKAALSGRTCRPRSNTFVTAVCSAAEYVTADRVRVIGERINPTGKKKFQQALKDGNIDYAVRQGTEQADAGADILDVNVGVPGIDEKAAMKAAVRGLTESVNLPLQIDSNDPEVIEAGLRLFPGKAIVNSVNGEDEKLEKVLPIVKKYGAAVVGLTIGESGIPETAEGRFAVAEKILGAARRAGIPDRNVLIDCLSLTVSANQEAAKETLRAVRMVREKLGLHTVLGVSNISFGLPCREEINRTFLAMAMESGLDLPIMNPNAAAMMDTVYAFRLLRGFDPGCMNYIERFKDRKKPEAAPAGNAAGNVAGSAGTGSAGAGNAGGGGAAAGNAAGRSAEAGSASGSGQAGSAGSAAGGGQAGSAGSAAGAPERSALAADLLGAVMKGRKKEAGEITARLLETKAELDIVNEDLIPALDAVGQEYESGRSFLPQLMRSAEAAQEAFSVIRERIGKHGDASVSKGKVILATVKGDIHDIGKNIVKTILANYGYEVIDLGRDVAPETVVEAAVREDVKLIGLSALMTTTLPSMEATVKALRKSGHDCRVMVGGAVMTPEYAKEIGADYYAKDAKRSADIAKEVLG